MDFKLAIEILYSDISKIESICDSLVNVNYLKIGSTGLLPSSELDTIDDFCRENKIQWFSEASSILEVDQLREYYSILPNGRLGFMLQIPSSELTNPKLLEHARSCSDYLIITIGHNSQSEVDFAIETFHPDLVLYEPASPIKLDYLKYLNHIHFEFSKKYNFGFSNILNKVSISHAAMMHEPNFILHRIDLTSHLDVYSGVFDVPNQLVTSLKEISESRGGYGFLSKPKKKKI